MMEELACGAPRELTRNIVEELRPEERQWFPHALDALIERNVPFLMAGAFGLYHYTGMWRGTKDIDFLILPSHREQAIEAITAAGFEDYFSVEGYDREWIYRSHRDTVIADLIWQLANKEDNIDASWFSRAEPAEFMGRPVQVASAADQCWLKLFVFQRKRNDWPDILNIIRATEGKLDWEHLLRQVGPHWRLLSALVEIYDWLCPREWHVIPEEFRDAMEMRRLSIRDGRTHHRHELFDSRPWLAERGAHFAEDEGKVEAAAGAQA